MLNLVYFSNVSENTHRFINRLTPLLDDAVKVHRIPLHLKEPVTQLDDYILISPTYGSETTAFVPPQVKKFLIPEQNRASCVGVIGAGNINFEKDYAVAGDSISQKLGVPLLYKFELSGWDSDLEVVKRFTEVDRDFIWEQLKTAATAAK